jgi:Protein of unknown function (DUF3093)
MYRERLVPGVGTILALLLLVPACLLVFLPISQIAGVISAVVVTGGAIAFVVGRAPIVEVRSGIFTAGKARVDVEFTGAAEAFRGPDATIARGVELDARAWTVLRGWVDPVVRVAITDAEDPAPYWVVSTRHPARLIEALEAARLAETR